MSKRKDVYEDVATYKEKAIIKKKLWYGYLMALVCWGLTGCAEKTATNETVKANDKETTISVEETTEPEETVAVETSETRENTTFRNTCWGDDKETVKRYEADVSWLGEKDDELTGMTSLFDRSDIYVRYGFGDGKLAGIYAYPDIDYADKKDLYMRDYYDIKGKLNDMYGEPYYDNPDNYWKETPNDEMEITSSWLTNSEYIVLGPVSHNNERWLQITYAEKNLVDGTQDTEAAPTSSTVEGVRPDFKEAMDSYEAFFDEYIAFMKKYDESSNTASMLTDYADYMTKYADTMNKMSVLQDSEMSAEESDYYVEVTTRINKKLIEATQ